MAEERDAAVERRHRRGDRGRVAPPTRDEEARRGAARPHHRHGVKQIADALLPGQAPHGADRHLVGGEAERRPEGIPLRPRGVEAGRVDALPEDVQLARGAEACGDVPALLAVRDHDPCVDVTPGEAVDPAAAVELVRQPEKERHATPGTHRTPQRRHARRLLRLDDHQLGALGPHRLPHAEDARWPGTAKVPAHGQPDAGRMREPRTARPSEEHARVPSPPEAMGGVHNPAFHPAVVRAPVRVDEEETHAAGRIVDGRRRASSRPGRLTERSGATIESPMAVAAEHRERHVAGGDVVRDLILGMSDGLTTPFALAAGLVGASTSNLLVVIGGLAEIAAGSISMGLGGYLAAQSQAETYRSELARETLETEVMPGEERAEVWRIFRNYGLRGRALEQATNAVTAERDAWVRFMMREELGLEEPAPRAALWSALRIAGGYVGAGLIPLAPYFFPLPLGTALLASCLLTGAALTGFGALKGRYVGAPTARSAFQMLLVGGAAAAIAFLTGRVLSQLAS